MPFKLTLPVRNTPRPRTHKGLPHVQLNVHPDPLIIKKMKKIIRSLPDIKPQNTRLAIPGSIGLWLDNKVKINREAVIAGREFAHLHPDGSLHICLPENLVQEVIRKGWGELYPLAKFTNRNNILLIYTPQNEQEMRIISQLLRISRKYASMTPATFVNKA